MTNEVSKTEPVYIHKRINATEMFRQKLHETDWAKIETSRNPNVRYKIFLKKFFFCMVSIFQLKY